MKIKKLKIKLNKDNEYSDYRYFMPKSSNITLADGENIDEAVQTLRDKVASLKEQASYLISKAPLIKYAEGSSITATQCASDRIRKLTIEGDSWQEAREGYNLFNSLLIPAFGGGSSGVECQIESDGTIILSNNTNPVGYVNTTKSLQELCPTLKPGDIAYLYIETTHSTQKIFLNGVEEDWNNTTLKNITQEMLDGQVSIYGGYEQVDTLKIQITVNTLITSYEQYGLMPSPEFSSEIQNISNDMTLLIEKNENYCPDLTQWELYEGAYYKEGYIVLPEATSYAQIIFPIKYNNHYVFKGVFNSTNSSSSPDAYFGISYYDKDMTLIRSNGGTVQITKDNTDTPLQTTVPYTPDVLPENTHYVKIQISRHKVYAIHEYKFKDISFSQKMLQAYIPGDNQYYIFPLTPNQKMRLNSYLAADGIHHKRGAYTFTGGESLQKADTQLSNTFSFYINFGDCKSLNVDDKILCNYFKQLPVADNYYTNDGEFCSTNISSGHNLIVFRINKKRLDGWDEDLSDGEKLLLVCNWLKKLYTEGNPMMVEYDLLQDKIESYTTEQQLIYNQLQESYLYYKTTFLYGISNNENMDINIKLIYKQDTNAILEEEGI